MSGICGTWTQARSDRGVVQAGLVAMAHRGPDGYSVYPDQSVVLGHCLLDTGRNGMFVDQDGYAITFDGRLDNRDQLVMALQKSGGDFRLQGEWHRDKALLLLAYRHFGDQLPSLLRGDFAFAIFDPVRDGLFLCRDHFGVRPLFYREGVGELHFASEIKALQAMAGNAAFGLRDEALTGFITAELDTLKPKETCFVGVHRLLPGHFAWIDASGSFWTERYWSLNPGVPIKRKNAAAEFRALLTQAISRRVEPDIETGVLLSGGLDSSAIVSLIGSGETGAALGGMKVCSLVFSGGNDESRYMTAVEDRFKFKAIRVDGSHVSAFSDCHSIVREHDQPIPATNIAGFRRFLRTIAQQQGVRIVLDGHGGDETVSYGNGIFQELAESGRWIRLWIELGSAAAFRPERGAIFARMLRRHGWRSWRRKLGWMLRRKPTNSDAVRFAPDGQRRPYEQAYHLSKFASPLSGLALEGIDQNAAATGVEVRMPFLDVDLVNFCVTVRAQDKWKKGISRLIVRKALGDILPEAVRDRQDKFDFADRIRNTTLAEHAGEVENMLADEDGLLAPYADLPALRESWRTLQTQHDLDGERFQELWRAVYLSAWLHARFDPDCLLEAAE